MGASRKLIAGICVLSLAIMLVLLFGTGAVNASPGDVLRCSTNSAWGQANSASVLPSISADGRYVAFESFASNLVPGDTNGYYDVFRKDLQTGDIVLCSIGSTGTPSNGQSFKCSISADGRYVAFESDANILVPGDTNGSMDIFRKDLQTGDVVLCSTNSTGGQGNDGSLYSSISADGRYVAFESAASNLVSGDTNGVADIFRKDLQTNAIVRCSTDSTGAQGNNHSEIPFISADGTCVAFQSSATNLVPGDTNGSIDVFRKDLKTNATACCSTDSTGALGDSFSYTPSLSSDGKYAAFFSYATNLVSEDTNGAVDVFRKDLQTNAIERCSTDSTGAQANNNSLDVSISPDGGYVAFESYATNLVPGDTNGTCDIFRKDLQTNAIVRCSTNSLGVQGDYSSSSPSISPYGAYVAFSSYAINLVPGDTNENVDVFRKELEATVPAPSITSIKPTNVSQFAFFLNVEITGSGFQAGAKARLEKGSGSVIGITNPTVTDSKITGSIFLFSNEPGAYDVVVVNPDGLEARLAGEFTVTPICGQGSGASLLMLGLTLGLLSLASTFRFGKKRNPVQQ